MRQTRQQEMFGIFLAILGSLFALVNNNLLWFGWDALWPTIPFLIGLLLLRIYAGRRKPRQLFVGSLLAQFGVFFFLFSSLRSSIPTTAPAVASGDRYLDFTALDHQGRSFTLSSLEGRPFILKFYRGYW